MIFSPSARRNLLAATVGGFGGAIAAAPTLPVQQVAASAVLCAAMAAVAVEDALRLRVPDFWVFAALASGLVWSGAMRLRSGENLVVAGGLALASALVCGGAFLAVREIFFRLRGADGLGFGDVKLAAAGGAWLGWEAFSLSVLVAAVGALGFVLVRVLRGGSWRAGQRLAFGAFLAPAIWGTWLVLAAADVQ